jgi:uncharacterized protein (DUF2267 family)
MSDTGCPAFSPSFEKTNQVLRDIETMYGRRKERQQQSYDALRAMLHALRVRLPGSEAADPAHRIHPTWQPMNLMDAASRR